MARQQSWLQATIVAVITTFALPLSVADRSHASGKPNAPSALDRARARELLAEANAALKASLIPRAVALYRQALRHWDHPVLHYNLTLALVLTDRPCELRHHLSQALALSRGGQLLSPLQVPAARQLQAAVSPALAAACDAPLSSADSPPP